MNTKSRLYPELIFLAVMLAFSLPMPGTAQRISGTNTAYEEGDWISYTQCRFVNSIQVAPDMVYIATEGGILRYDFYANQWLFPFTTSNGLPDNLVLAVAYDVATGLLWCSTPKAISVYDGGSHLWQNFYLDQVGVSGSDPVYSFGFASSGVWVETRSGRHYFTPLNEFHFSPKTETPDSSVVWFGARGFKGQSLGLFFLPNSLLFIDDGNQYYIQDQELRNFPLSYYTIDPWQMIWAGTAGRGLFAADTRIRQMSPLRFGLLNPDVRAIAKKGPELWIGGIQSDSNLSGITDWNRDRNRWTYFEPRLISRFRNDEIQAIAISGGSIWFATRDGLTRYQPERDRWNTYTVFHGLQDNLIYTVVGEDSTLWVGSNDGLDCLFFFPSFPDSIAITPVIRRKDRVPIYDIFLDGTLVWAGTGYGLYAFQLLTQTGGYYRGADGPGVEPVIAVSRMRDSLWVATSHAVEVYDLLANVWRGSPGRKLFANTNILDLTCGQPYVWVGTEDGLYKFHVGKGYWKHYTPGDGLLHPHVQTLLLDGDYLWIGTPAGLTRFFWNSPYRID